MNATTDEKLLARPEASWAQVTFLVPIRESSPVQPSNSVQSSYLPVWESSVSGFAVKNETGVNTDRAWRSRLIASGAQGILYDRRYHSVLTPPAVLDSLDSADGRRVTLEATHLEFLPTGILPGFGPGGILAVHAQMEDSSAAGHAPGTRRRLPVRWLASAIKGLARPAAGTDAAVGIAGFAGGWGLRLDPGTEIVIAVNIACPESTLRVLRPDPEQAGRWDALTLWTWALARGTVPTPRMLREPRLPAGPGRPVPLPHRTAIVDRSGLAIVGTRPVDTDPSIGQILSDRVPVFQSIYVDVLLLGYLELLVAVEVGARLDRLDDPGQHPREFHGIELRMRFLHTRIWRSRVSEWPWLSSALSSFREENDLPALIAQLNDNMRDFGDQIERGFQHGLNVIILLLSALGFLGVIAGIFGSVAAFMSVFGTGHWGAIVGIIGTSVGIIAMCGMAALFLRTGAWRELTQYIRR